VSEIVVVGAGIIGCAVAYELARRGAAVQVVDARPAGMGATQAAAGVLAPHIEARHAGPLSTLTARSLELYDTFIAGVTADSGRPVTYRRTGTLDVALTIEEMRRLTEAADDLARCGVKGELLDARSVRSAEPQLAPGVVGGLSIPAHGFVAAAGLAQALEAGARHFGAQFVEPARVTSIAPVGSHLRLETERGPLSGGTVVLAAGSWSGLIPIAGVSAALPVRPVRGQLLHLAWNGPQIHRVTWGKRCYLVPWGDGTLLVGATVEEAGFDERATVAGVRELLDAACEIVPHASTAALVSVKVGLRPASGDGLPLIGVSSVVPNLLYATGHFRNGILLAPLTAQLVADVILDRRISPMLAMTSPQRFGML
jgi:glycine oxidase